MQDFPPRIATFFSGSDDAPTPDPDTRSPAAFLRWMLRQQWQVIAWSTLACLLWLMPLTFGPYIFGRAVDEGILAGSRSALLGWAGVMLAVVLVGGVFGVVFHTLVVRSWLISLYGTTQMVTRKIAQMGHVLPRRSPTGEILSVSSSDSDEFGALTEILARSVAQLVSYLTVAAIVLSMSWQLGVVVLVAAPVLLGAALPLLRPLHRRQQVERSRNSELTSMATDIVAGLRILRGIGGEETFGRNYAEQSQQARRAGVSSGIWQAAVEAVGVLFSGVFLVTLVWLGTRQVDAGELSVGQLVSFLGYGLFMVGPIRTFFELAQKSTRALVSARRAIAIFEQRPPWREPSDPQPLDGRREIVDELSGFTAHPGQLTVIVSAVPEQSSALADRLGRYLPPDTDPVGEDDGDGLKGRAARQARADRERRRARIAARDEAVATREWGVRLGDVDLSAARLDDVRSQVLVSDTGSSLFAGTLQDAIDPHGRLTREQAEAALRVANAEDVYDALPEGWQGQLDERGRGLSGGQRQRVVLARALAADAPILVLVEPTSAVDAHTEARIAERVTDLRRGRTTVVCTVSPLWLHHADRVVLLRDGLVAAEGEHAALLEHDAAYRDVVLRAMDDVDEEVSS
ncbi:ABC-type multidrug transport system, ATPase and permease component [Nocardioides alpinus]|uniref:ABC transporter ATP-binding protein n=1 Tax=Nocardioides alpinus TaxID=748909 RepID=A0A1I0YVP9_9ACTN|nr:ABC transporter ATP-binding protein [Nocardioides alpinus]PKH43791.1 ABC transporter ATP-binding protein [Nocardioides alpinus]SFB17479.1 ABC-type multidrug transport system, ATPase and permease component [Nocardioides alpinus]